MPKPTPRTRPKKPIDAKFAEKVFPKIASGDDTDQAESLPRRLDRLERENRNLVERLNAENQRANYYLDRMIAAESGLKAVSFLLGNAEDQLRNCQAHRRNLDSEIPF